MKIIYRSFFFLTLVIMALVVIPLCISKSYAADFTFQWDANHPNDNVVAYRIYWSETSGSFNTTDREEIPVASLTDPNNPEWILTLSQFNEDDKVYFVATAVDDEGFESDYSNQVQSSSVSVSGDFQEGFYVDAGNYNGFDFYGSASPSVAVSFDISGGANLGSIVSNPDGSWSTNLDFSGVAQGEFTLIVTAGGDSVTITGFLDSVVPLFDEVPLDTARTLNSATIEWETSEPTTSRIEYSAIQGNPPLVQEDNVLKDVHLMTLTGLAENTTIYYTVIATDTVGNVLTSVEKTLQTAADVTLPVIESFNWIDKSDTTATIQWHVNEQCDSVLRYGTASTGDWAALPTAFPVDSGSGTRTVTLSGLTPGQIYYFMVRAEDLAGNWAVSDEKSVTTDSAGDITAPVFEDTPTAKSIGVTSAKIEWTTDELANGKVYFGLDSSYGDIVEDLDTYEIPHSISLTGLSPDTTYHFMVESWDDDGNGPTSSSERQFTTLPALDTTAPTIQSGPTVTDQDDQSVSITWETNELSNSMVRYGQSSSGTWDGYPGIHNETAMVKVHNVTISGLTPGTEYFYRVGSIDGAENGPTVSSESGFITEETEDIVAPQFILPPTVTGKTDTTAVIEWETDENSDSQVQYGTASSDWGAYTLSKNSTSMVKRHVVTLTGLEPLVTYHLRVASTDLQGNGPAVSHEIDFTTEDPLAGDARPRVTSPPTVTAISDRSATIEWETDEPSDSEVRFATSESAWEAYTNVVIDNQMVTRHQVVLTDLTPEVRYYFRVASTDAAGNGPNTELTETNNPFSQDIFKTEASSDNQAPRILSGPTIATVDSSSAVITWETDEPSNSLIQYGLSFDPAVGWGSLSSTANDAEMATQHSVTITGLTDKTLYYFAVGSQDESGNGPGVNNDASNPSAVNRLVTTEFIDTTAPVISNVVMSWATDKTALITWDTNEPANGIVKFENAVAGEEWTEKSWAEYNFEEGDAEMLTKHSVTITGLQPGTTYYYRIGSTDAKGNGPDPSAEGHFTSSEFPDTSAPRISNVTYTVNIAQKKAVIIWKTDEPGNSQVQFDLTSKGWGAYSNSENDAEMVRDHNVTLTDLEIDTLYFIRVSSVDASGNNYAISDSDDNPSIEYEMILEKPSEGIDDTEEDQAEGSCFIQGVKCSR